MVLKLECSFAVSGTRQYLSVQYLFQLYAGCKFGMIL